MFTQLTLHPDSGVIKKIIIFLHGYGSCAENMMFMAEQFSKECPDTLLIGLQGPEVCESYPQGYQWFHLPDLNPLTMRQGLDSVAIPFLKEFIKNCINNFHIHAQDIALVGFSQGTIVSLDTLFTDISVGAIIGYSGALFPPASPHINTSTKILLIHGTHDTVVPYGAMLQAELALKALNTNIETYTCMGLEHYINEEGMEKGLSFLKQHFLNHIQKN